MHDHLIFTELEDPIPIMFWDPLEFILGISLLGFGIISNLWMIGLAAGGLVLFGSKYLKRGSKKGAAQHAMWKAGLQFDPCLTKKFPPSWKKDFVA